MINKKFNVAAQVRDCLRRNCVGDNYVITGQTESAIRRLVYKAYRLGCIDGRLTIVKAARMSLSAGGVRGTEAQCPASEAKL